MLSLTVVATLIASLLGAEAQPARMPRIGYLSGASATEDPRNVEAFRHALRELGWREGQNVVTDYRWWEGKSERLPELAAALVRLNPDVIVAVTPSNLVALSKLTTTIPLVMVFGPDPVALGLATSLARPGGNVTGVTTLSADLTGKHLEILREAVPGLTRVALLWNPDNPWHPLAVKELEARGRPLGVALQWVGIRRPHDLDSAFAAMTRERAGGVIVFADPMTFVHRVRIIELAARHRLPAIYGLREYADAGGLVSYWPNTPETFRRAAVYVDRILKGARPAELPIEQPTTFDLVLNLRTARALGLQFPPTMLLRAAHVIE